MTQGESARAPRRPGFRRGVRALAVPLVALCGWCLSVGTAPAAGPRVPAVQPLVVLLEGHAARTGPAADARRIETVGARRPLTNVRTVLPELGSAVDAHGSRWLHVRLPGRPSGHTGRILADRTRHSSTGWRIDVA